MLNVRLQAGGGACARCVWLDVAELTSQMLHKSGNHSRLHAFSFLNLPMSVSAGRALRCPRCTSSLLMREMRAPRYQAGVRDADIRVCRWDRLSIPIVLLSNARAEISLRKKAVPIRPYVSGA